MNEITDYISFLKRLVSEEQFLRGTFVLTSALSLPESFDKTKVKKLLIDFFEDGLLSLTKERLEACLGYYNEFSIVTNKHKEISEKLNLFQANVKSLLDVVSEVIIEKTPKETDDASNQATALNSYDEKMTELLKRLEPIENKVQHFENSLNEKLFALIINTVTILGIFVAVAFGGIGSLNLIEILPINNSIDADVSLNIFYISLGVLFVYNLLFLLFYCIFKIIEKINKEKNISVSKDCKYFVIIDIIGVVFSIAMFVVYCLENNIGG